MKATTLVSLASLLILTCLGVLANWASGSKTPFPNDWKNWSLVTTPLVKVGGLPGCDADVGHLPQIYQATVATYCGLRPEGPGKVSVRVRPSMQGTYKERSGNFADGTNLILHLEELKVFLVTGHIDTKPVYGVYSEDGKDLMTPSGPLSHEVCANCHTGYQAFCINGQCGVAR